MLLDAPLSNKGVERLCCRHLLLLTLCDVRDVVDVRFNRQSLFKAIIAADRPEGLTAVRLDVYPRAQELQLGVSAVQHLASCDSSSSCEPHPGVGMRVEQTLWHQAAVDMLQVDALPVPGRACSHRLSHGRVKTLKNAQL